MNANQSPGHIDHGALRANQVVIVVSLLAAFVFGLPLIVLATGLVMALGTVAGRPGFLPLYLLALRPLGLIKPDVLPGDRRPHRFAQAIGAILLLLGGAALANGAFSIGWTLAWLVIALALVNLLSGFCAGCFIHYQATRLGLPGFGKIAPPSAAPGVRRDGKDVP